MIGSSKPRAAQAYLLEAIRAYLANQESNLNEFAREVLARLANDPDSAEAFASLKLKDQSEEAAILATCIAADDLARSFSKRIQDAENTVARMERLSEAVTTLRAFVEELTSKRDRPTTNDMLSVTIPDDPPGSINAMHRGLYWIDDRIGTTQRVAKEDQMRLGATRKNGLAKGKPFTSDRAETIAPQNAAIGWLAEGVRRVTGKAHLTVVADLAQVILRTSLTVDRVRAAARTRNREWRRP